MITVPCCNNCNKSFSKDDEYFMLMTIIREELSENGEIIKLLPKINRMLSRKEAEGMTKALINSIKRKVFKTPSGIILPPAEVIEVEQDRLNKVVKRIISGLIKVVIKDDEKKDIVVFPLEFIKPTDLYGMNLMFSKLLPAVEKQTVNTIGNGDVFGFQFVSPKENNKMYLWKLYFYKQIVYIGISKSVST